MFRQIEMQNLKNQKGFTLIEMLVVVIILGILAMIIVPQISVSTDDARLNTLQTNLNSIRSAIEVYAAQHANRYPGTYSEADGTTAVADDAAAKQALLAQLTQFTDVNGMVNGTKTATFKYGPYLKTGTLPLNPFNDSGDVVVDFDQADITAARNPSGGAEGWQYFAPIGVFFANDSAAHAAL
ncbi:MAG: type II secretion system protein [Syntrophobacterales bacterium]|jgi:prepilin-type N-terminal cleavage/methylation domain-containing protein